jgi:8-oxo-dGTP pyrophosphatase MutT (NUDIX family)
LLLTTGSQILLLKRSAYVADPGLWGIPGGAIPRDPQTGERMNALISAHRETEEELGGVVPRYQLVKTLRNEVSDTFTYTTFIGRVEDPESAVAMHFPLDWESDDWTWATVDDLGELDLHPGVEWALSEAWFSIYDTGSRAKVSGTQLDRTILQVLNPGEWTAALTQAEQDEVLRTLQAQPGAPWRLLRMESEPELTAAVLGLTRTKTGAWAAYVAVRPPPLAPAPLQQVQGLGPGQSVNLRGDEAVRAYRRVLGRLRPQVTSRRMIQPSVRGGVWKGWRVWTAPIRAVDAQELGLGT